jgi:hypothetical protein
MYVELLFCNFKVLLALFPLAVIFFFFFRLLVFQKKKIIDNIMASEHLQFEFLKLLKLTKPIKGDNEDGLNDIHKIIKQVLDNESENESLGFSNFCSKIYFKKLNKRNL